VRKYDGRKTNFDEIVLDFLSKLASVYGKSEMLGGVHTIA
jgi:hypothetical protein